MIRLHHDAIRTERAYCDWVVIRERFTGCSPENLAGGKDKLEAFLADLAVRGNVAASTLNQALQALLFLYGRVLDEPLQGLDVASGAPAGVAPKVSTTNQNASNGNAKGSKNGSE